jgi:NAD(P)-dependent dehydrogenase (short-subunit alcohol dehydrogenase family)
LPNPSYAPDTAPSVADLFSMRGKTALIVGGAGLLGGEIAFAFAELGASLIIASRDLEKCRSYAARIVARFPEASVHALEVDIAVPDSIRLLCDAVGLLTGGVLDILVNSGWSGRKNTFDSITDEDWDYDVEICLNGPFRTVKAAVPLLKASRGTILTLASMYGHVAPDYRLYDSDRLANPPSYGAGKAGIIQLTRYLASYLSPHGIRANCISPGPFPFEQTQADHPAFIERLAAKNPLNRIGRPFELKGAAVLLCSDAGSYITGQNICVDGGWSIW